jgi:hypothetical protein
LPLKRPAALGVRLTAELVELSAARQCGARAHAVLEAAVGLEATLECGGLRVRDAGRLQRSLRVEPKRQPVVVRRPVVRGTKVRRKRPKPPTAQATAELVLVAVDEQLAERMKDRSAIEESVRRRHRANNRTISER